jgi:methionyl-tRNA formyltransferase
MTPSRKHAVRRTYVVAGCKSWNRRIFDEELAGLPGEWHYIGSPEDFSAAHLRKLAPRYIFFLHWSWKVPSDVVENYECVCFHMTDVPYGRGGSPLQNLIARGHRETKLTALRMTGDFDAGPVYLKERLSLQGSAEETYLRAARISAEMIKRLVREEPDAKTQQGEVVNFKRRKPEDSRIERQSSLEELHDFIRMLDADGYPHAFLEYGKFRLEFNRSALYDGRVVADVRITLASAAREAGA